MGTTGCRADDRPPASTGGGTSIPFGSTGDEEGGPSMEDTVGSGGTTAGNTAGNVTAEGDGGCGEVQVQVDTVIPTIVLLVDQSGSMTADFGGAERWDAVYQALMNSTDGIVTALESQVRFGLTLYSSIDGDQGGQCPMLTEVGPALGNRDAIDAVYSQADPLDETPTGESLGAVAQSLAAVEFQGPKVIILATDGEPDTCAVPNPQEGQPESLEAAEQAYDLGISTYIISVGNEVGEEHLAQMANVGVGREPDDANQAPYYQADNTAELVAALSEIIGGFVSCELVINGEVDLEQKCSGTVMLDGQVLECGVDYDVTDPTTLVLLGEACETLKNGEPHEVSATFPCGAVNIP